MFFLTIKMSIKSDVPVNLTFSISFNLNILYLEYCKYKIYTLLFDQTNHLCNKKIACKCSKHHNQAHQCSIYLQHSHSRRPSLQLCTFFLLQFPDAFWQKLGILVRDLLNRKVHYLDFSGPQIWRRVILLKITN